MTGVARSGWASLIGGHLGRIRSADRWRSLRPVADGRMATTVVGGPSVVNFASNDYLGLSTHPKVVEGAIDAVRREGAGAGASRLVTGDRPSHHLLEVALADWKGSAAALVFPTGFAANVGVLTALARVEPDALICSDGWNHASIIDGCRLARARSAVYPHGDLGELDRLLAAAPGRGIVVTDAVFSMDGDVASVEGLAASCARHGALLVLDEAHSVFGPHLGPQVFEGVGLDPSDVIRVGTLSKTLGAQGGFVAGTTEVIDLLVNTARPFVFSTGLNPAATGAALAALGVVCSAEGEGLVAGLRTHVDRLRPGHPSAIVPVVVGEEGEAVAAAGALRERGLLVPAIRPPTVPPGTSRLRVTLSAAHSHEDVSRLLHALAELGLAEPGRPAFRAGVAS